MDVSDLFNVKGKVVLVTGGAKGIGRMITTAFALNGSRVYICGRDGKACEATAKEVNELISSSHTSKAKEGSVVSLQADLAKLSECQRVAAELGKREKKLHVLVHNSGAAWGQSLEDFPDSAWTKLLTLNLQRVFSLTQLLLPLLEAAAVFSPEDQNVPTDPARIIHIGSIDALRVPNLENYAYSASKAGLHHLSRVLATKLGSRGITSNTLACGPFETKMMAAVLQQLRESVVAGVPVGRIGTPQDVGGACLFLASRAGAFVNGATLSLDGGAHLMARL